jgi:hypothetical protein
LDIAFVDDCVNAFEEVDSSGETFRYPVKQFKMATQPPILRQDLHISYHALLNNMEHAKDVLEAIDTYLVEAHGDIRDWEAEQDSWC